MYDLFLKRARKKTVVRLLNEAGHRTRNGSLFTSKTLAEIDLTKVNTMSTEEVAAETSGLVDRWSELFVNDKRVILETIVEKITVGQGEIEPKLCYASSCHDMAFGWRKGRDSNPR